MPENDLNQMTQEEFDKLQAKYSEMVKVKQKEIADALREARSYGDLSENAEYDAAKENEAKFHEELQAPPRRGLKVRAGLDAEREAHGVGVDADYHSHPPW